MARCTGHDNDDFGVPCPGPAPTLALVAHPVTTAWAALHIRSACVLDGNQGSEPHGSKDFNA